MGRPARITPAPPPPQTPSGDEPGLAPPEGPWRGDAMRGDAMRGDEMPMTVYELAAMLYRSDRGAFEPYKTPRGAPPRELDEDAVRRAVDDVASRCQELDAHPLIRGFFDKNKRAVVGALVAGLLRGSAPG